MVSTSKTNNKKADADASAYSHNFPVQEEVKETVSHMLTVRRMFSLLDYLVILTQFFPIVKEKNCFLFD